mmetsp:Transcript_13405/g.20084  ORF Transcript_13405/g.20084 Transcript_13405/m.20084 type:complete len:84 (-) Transcript_13405:201-452(-)
MCASVLKTMNSTALLQRQIQHGNMNMNTSSSFAVDGDAAADRESSCRRKFLTITGVVNFSFFNIKSSCNKKHSSKCQNEKRFS